MFHVIKLLLLLSVVNLFIAFNFNNIGTNKIVDESIDGNVEIYFAFRMSGAVGWDGQDRWLDSPRGFLVSPTFSGNSVDFSFDYRELHAMYPDFSVILQRRIGSNNWTDVSNRNFTASSSLQSASIHFNIPTAGIYRLIIQTPDVRGFSVSNGWGIVKIFSYT